MDDDELWEQIEAAGPLSWADALAEPPPPGVDADAWSERSLTQSDRRRTFIALCAWAVPNRQAIAGIQAFVGNRRLLEVGAGSGLWASLLSSAGVEVLATDAIPAKDTEYFSVEALEAEAAVRAHRACEALLLCWPPFRNDCAFRALRAFIGDSVVYVGDVRFTGDQQLHTLLEQVWTLCELIPIPSWPGLDDRVYLYRRDSDACRSERMDQ